MNDFMPAFQQVDHTGEYEFRHLVSEYARIHHGGDENEIDEAAFSTFHEKNAKLQVLCVHCNVRKKRKAQDTFVSQHPIDDQVAF